MCIEGWGGGGKVFAPINPGGEGREKTRKKRKEEEEERSKEGRIGEKKPLKKERGKKQQQPKKWLSGLCGKRESMSGGGDA